MLMYKSENFIQFLAQFNVFLWLWDRPYHKMIYDKKFSEHTVMSKHRWTSLDTSKFGQPMSDDRLLVAAL